jgi:cyclic pyranopterin phosphate synthase
MSGGFDGLDRVLDGIHAALEAGLAPVKVNAVVQRGVNDGEAVELARHFRGTGVVVRFIEYMDVGNRNDWRPGLVVPSRELRDRIAASWPLSPLAPTQSGEVAERYAYADGGGEIGFISSVTQPFCGGCSRARISSDGVFYTCLFATAGTDLRAALRGGQDDEEIRRTLRAVWRGRSDRYSELRSHDSAAAQERKIEMYYIGG